MVMVAGIDAYKRGWVSVVLKNRMFRQAQVWSAIEDLLAGLDNAAVIGVDIPIGLPKLAKRAADVAAREFVGPRRSSVFATPPRAVLEAASYEEARHVARAVAIWY